MSTTGLPERWDDLPKEWRKTQGMRNPGEYAKFLAANKQQMHDMQMASSTPTKVAFTGDIASIAEEAANFPTPDGEGLNRQISEEGLALLNPEGVHLLKPILVHRHAGGEEVEAHMRVIAYLAADPEKIKERVEDPALLKDPEALAAVAADTASKPFELTLDVPMPYILGLPSVAEYRKLVGLPPEKSDEEDWTNFISSFNQWATEHRPGMSGLLDSSLRREAHRRRGES